jgi:hypothetical protein
MLTNDQSHQTSSVNTGQWATAASPRYVALAVMATYALLPMLLLVSGTLFVLVLQLHRAIEPLSSATTSQLNRLIEQTEELAKTASATQRAVRSISTYIATQRSLSRNTASVLKQWSDVSQAFQSHLQDGARLCEILAASLPSRLPSGVDVDWKKIEIPGPNLFLPVDIDLTWKYFDVEKAKLEKMSQSLVQARSAMESTGTTLAQLSQAIGKESEVLIASSLSALEEADSHLNRLSGTTLPSLAQQLEVERQTAERLPLVSRIMSIFFLVVSLALVLLGICLVLVTQVLRGLRPA